MRKPDAPRYFVSEDGVKITCQNGNTPGERHGRCRELTDPSEIRQHFGSRACLPVPATRSAHPTTSTESSTMTEAQREERLQSILQSAAMADAGTLGERFTESPTYARARARRFVSDALGGSVELLSADELATRTLDVSPVPPSQNVTRLPVPTPLLGRLTIVPAKSQQIHSGSALGLTGEAALAPFGTALPEITSMDADDEIQTLQPFGCFLTADNSVFDDKTLLAKVIERVVEDLWAASLEAAVLVGTTEPLVGVAANATPVTAMAGALLDSIEDAAAGIESGGFGGIIGAANPDTVKLLNREARSSGLSLAAALPDVTWLKVPKLPDGQAVLGDFTRGCTLHSSGMRAAMSIADSEVFSEGRTTLRVSADVVLRVHFPTQAFAAVDGLSQ